MMNVFAITYFVKITAVVERFILLAYTKILGVFQL